MSFWGFPWPWLSLARRKAITRFLARSREFERPERAPRSPAGTHACTVVYRRPPCVPHSRERQKRPAAGRAAHANVYKKFISYMYIVVRHSRGSFIAYPLLYLQVATPAKNINSSEAFIHMQETPPHERFLVGCSSPFMRLAPNISRRFALGASNVCLVGENPTCSVSAL